MDRRQSLKTIGEFLNNRVVDVIMALISTVFFIPQIHIIEDILTIDFSFVGIFLAIAILFSFVIYYIGKTIIIVSDNLPTNMGVAYPIFPNPQIETNIEYGNPKLAKTTAFIIIANKEKEDVTDCYATLARVKDVALQRDITRNICGISPMQLVWKTLDGDQRKIKINQKGEAILYVYQVFIDLDTHKIHTSDFCVYNGGVRRILGSLSRVYDVEIDIFGKPGTKKTHYCRVEIDLNISDDGETIISHSIKIGSAKKF